MQCPDGHVFVPQHCRRRRSRPRNTEEAQIIKRRIAELEEGITTRATPSFKNFRLEKAPHELIDNLARSLDIAMFTLPRFFVGAVPRMRDPRYRAKFPDPVRRYRAVAQKFLAKEDLRQLPDVYELVVLKLMVA